MAVVVSPQQVHVTCQQLQLSTDTKIILYPSLYDNPSHFQVKLNHSERGTEKRPTKQSRSFCSAKTQSFHTENPDSALAACSLANREENAYSVGVIEKGLQTVGLFLAVDGWYAHRMLRLCRRGKLTTNESLKRDCKRSFSCFRGSGIPTSQLKTK